jgi:large repetitive protein
LPAGAGASWNGTAITLAIGNIATTPTATGFAITLTPSPFALTVKGRLNGLPVINTAFAQVGLSTTGLQELVIDVGPASIDMAGVALRPQFNVVAGLAHTSDASSALLLGLPGNRAVGVRWLIGQRLDLVLRNGAAEITAPDQVALGLLEAVLDIVASFVMRVPEVALVLAKPVGASTVRAVLDDALLVAASDPPRLVPQPFDLAQVLPRLQRLALNIARARPSITIDGALTLGLTADAVGGNDVVALTLDLPRPAVLLNSDITISLESDARWIRMPSGTPPAQGLVVQMLQVGPGLGSFTFAPGLQVNGLGLRVARREQPLIASDVLSLGSIALHVFARVDAGGRAGGAQLQLSSLSVAPAGASAGGNGVAQGMLSDAGSGSDRLAPTFSPALAVQKHGNDDILVNLRAGDGAGPWWLSIQRGFGPIYIEQVGFGVAERDNTLEKISLLLDGRISLFGLTAAVDDLQLTHTVASDASVFDSSRWAVDLAGLAFNADLGGIFLQGGLRKFGDGQNARYVGMLMGRFAVYGLSVFGGYGEGVVDGQKFSSFFAFGAVNGPIGGPPAFFLTGIGGGLGINRALLMPPDMSQFGNYPFIKALDPAARPSTDPMAELLALDVLFPMKRGNFWFAAGVSFTSFALVDGVAVITIQIGDGFEVALLGLARMALPRPQLPIVSIELGLVARFSSKEGVLWVQAQLTDNSWLLYPDVRLTGGFAFVVWFAGPNAGQFVLTIGGYHPNFRREGYPMVPRLGLVWRLGEFITIKGESYFALTSEALMAGLRVEVSARFGPAWAQVIFGADGIVFFDPFYFQVLAYASISAGVTIDVWIGEITISISIGADIMVEGPEFHGIARFSVGPVGLTVEFGERNQPPRPPLPWGDFVRKYLEEAAPARARAVAAIAGKGAVTPGTGPGGATDTGTADGTAAKPFEVYAECEITLTSTVPLARIDLGGRIIARTPSAALSVAPMRLEGVDTVLRIDLLRKSDGASFTAGLKPREHVSPSFPYGVWGPPQDPGKPKVPEGKVITALDGLTLISEATIPPGSAPIDYRRVETAIATTNHPRTRHPLPFVSEARERAARLAQARTLAQALPGSAVQNDDEAVLRVAAQWSERAGGSRTAAHALKGLRAAPPRLGSLSEGLADVAAPLTAVSLPLAHVVSAVNTTVQRPRAVGVLTLGIDEPERLAERTTVQRPPSAALRVANPPSVAQVQAEVDAAVPAVLKVVSTTRGATQGRTVVAADSAPLTRMARAPLAAVRGRGATRDVFERLQSLDGALQRKAGARGAIPTGAQIASGEVAVFELPNAHHDVTEGPRPALTVTGQSARVVMLAAGGLLVADVEVGGTQAAAVIVPKGAHHIAVAVGLPGAAQRAGLAGWHSGAMLPMVGHQSALAAEAIVQCEGRVRSLQQRGLVREAGWLRGAELVEGAALVHTRFTHDVTEVAVILDDPTVSMQNAGRRAISVSWEGAQLAVDAKGEPLAPLAVVRGQRVALIYSLLPEPGIEGVGVSVASQEDWHLVGVVAARAGDSAQTLANQLANGELDQLVRGPVVGDVGLATIGWRTAEEQQRLQPSSSPRAKRVLTSKRN